MRRILMMIALLAMLAMPVHALEITVPEVPKSAAQYMPEEPENLSQALLNVLRDAMLNLRPELRDAASVCLGVIGAAMTVSLFQHFPGNSHGMVEIAGAVAVSAMMLQTSNSLVNLASDTIIQISEYGKLLLPVMTAALAAEGGAAESAAIYTGTALFDAMISSLISKILVPMVYLFLTLAVSGSAVGNDLLKKLRDTMKSFMTWMLKTVLYVYTGYISITGVISGTTDAAALKAAKLTISGAVPVVGGILSDASEAVLVSAGMIKNSAGIYGMFAIIAIWLGPFLKVGGQYLFLKATGVICGIFGSKRISELIQDFSSALGLLLAMTGAACLMFLISLICFIKGAS